MAGLIGMVGSGEIPSGSCVLFSHLGGQTCLSAYAGVL
jgi:1-aminocyclopropane-1-carboxylate deaminase